MAMLTDPSVQAVVPPWGGELAVEVLPHLDWPVLGAADPTWLVGYSDLSTLLLPLSIRTATAALYGQNLMDTPYRVPAPLVSWLDVASRPAGATITQGPSSYHRRSGFDRWQDDPTTGEYTLDTPGTWRLLDPNACEVHVSGRLLGGCIETVSILAGNAYGDVPGVRPRSRPRGLVYVEASGDIATDIARDLWRRRLAGWFDHANAVVVGRTRAPDAAGFTQLDAVRSALDDIDVPVVVDVDCGHIPPHLALVNGAPAQLTFTNSRKTLTQTLC